MIFPMSSLYKANYTIIVEIVAYFFTQNTAKGDDAYALIHTLTLRLPNEAKVNLQSQVLPIKVAKSCFRNMIKSIRIIHEKKAFFIRKLYFRQMLHLNMQIEKVFGIP